MQATSLFDVRGLAVFITGAASGIGYGYAQALARHGAHVSLSDADPQALQAALERLRAEIRELFPDPQTAPAIEGHVADVTRPETVRAALAAHVAQRGRVDVLFANAGVSAGPGFLRGDGSRNEAGALENLSLETFDRATAVNLRGALVTLQAAVPFMKTQRAGRIILTTTVSLFQTETLVSTLYVASKAALGQLVRQAALELATYGILVNGIAPGPTVTNIGGGRLQDAAARAPFERLNPLQRIATPADLHGAALFLASPASSFVTGTQIVVDGGACLGAAP